MIDTEVSVKKAEKKKVVTYRRWTNAENLIYCKFLFENRELFGDSKMKRKLKVFKKLSELIESKCLKQCKSHHQKMNLQHGRI